MYEPEDEWDLPIFPFQELHYVPCGSVGILAPYIETGAGTMRAAVELMMGLSDDKLRQTDAPTLSQTRTATATATATSPPSSTPLLPAQAIVCDLGCGDASFLLSLLTHLHRLQALLPSPPPPARGVGVDYDPALVAAGARDALAAGLAVDWLTYDFNADEDDMAGQLLALGVTHVFVYLVPKQLALGTVRGILTRLRGAGVVVCSHRYHPKYFEAERVDEVMGLQVYEL